MANPDDPDPPIGGREQDIDSAAENPAAEASPGPEESTAGGNAAPAMAHAEELTEAAGERAAPPETANAQDREQVLEAPDTALQPQEIDAAPDFMTAEPAGEPVSEPDIPTPSEIVAVFETYEPALAPPEADAESDFLAGISPPAPPQPAAASSPIVAVFETYEPIIAAPPVERTESEPDGPVAQDILEPEAAIESHDEPDPAVQDGFAAPAPALRATEPSSEDPALFLDVAEEPDADETTLFPATPAQDEAALLTPGLEPAPPSAPEMAAEIIPYRPPVDHPITPPASDETSEHTATIAARANPEDLAAPPNAAPQPAAIVAMAAALAWLRQKAAPAAAWLHARLPQPADTPSDPSSPAPARRTFRPAPGQARQSGFHPNLRRIAIFSGWATVIIAAGVCGFFIYLTRDMPSTRSLWTRDNSPSLAFVDRRGRVIIREGAENGPPADVSKLPPYVAQSMIAIEDRRFYSHAGIDVNGLMRAAASNVKAGHVVQGGSTITQQLAKNLFLSNSRTFQRKLQEVALALWLESQFSKREILSLYISRVYFGAGAYGIEAAAERYFDKPAKELTLPEAALLAGLVKAPSKLNPASQDAAAKARAKIVLDEMLGAGFINARQHAAALKAPLSISRFNPNGNLGYFRDWIDPQLTQILGEQRDDFIIETTLDLEAQRAAESTLEKVIERERKLRNVSQGAILAMDSTGGVTTMVGGLNYGKGEGQSEFNRTTQSLRAPGSSFKYFIYLAAMSKGMSPWDIYVDKPVVYGDWAPGNYEDKYFGPVSLTSAYAKSLNMVAIQLANDVGGRAVIGAAQSLGVGKRLQDYRSLGLGAQGMTVLEMVTGYGAMASGGYPVEPHGIERVRRPNGQVLWARRPAAPPRQVIDDRTMRMMNYLGARVVQAGTGTRAQIPGREIAGKTGTSNDYRDAWFIAYVPGMVAGVWVGNDNNTSMTKVTGGLLAAEIWHDVMLVALRDTPIQQLAMPQITDMPAPEEEQIGAVTETPPGAPLEMAQPGAPPEAPLAPLAITPVGGDGG